MAVWCPLYHVKMTVLSSALEAFVVVGFGGSSLKLTVDVLAG